MPAPGAAAYNNGVVRVVAKSIHKLIGFKMIDGQPSIHINEEMAVTP